jgi:peptidoglycan-N-acetylglucosamine deacetylase
MSRCRRAAFAALTMALVGPLFPAERSARQVAITIDDLPLGGGDRGPCDFQSVSRMTARLLKPFIAQRVPLTGFVNEGRRRNMTPRELRAVLDMWLDAGADLGNHTYSHADLSHTPVAQFEAEIVRGETVTRAALADRSRKLRYFRHPYLHTGLDMEARRAIEDFLEGHGYRVAPVTLDNSDYMFAAVYGSALDRGDREMVERVARAYVPYLESIVAFFEGRSREVAGHAFPQILLLHANRLNAESMPAVLQMLRTRGYEFVTLDQALQDEAYRLPDLYAGPGGFSWIHRWSITKQMKPRGEPDEPAFIGEQYRKQQQK